MLLKFTDSTKRFITQAAENKITIETINMLEKIQQNNIYYYVLPSGTTLYKGLYDDTRINNISSYEWYALDQETAETYGNIYVYNNKKQLLLFAMDERSNIEHLMASARLQGRNDVINALRETFMLYDEQPNVVIRNSEDKSDKLVAEFICKNNYNGYGADEMMKGLNTNNKFHSEIMVCNANNVIEYTQQKIITTKSLYTTLERAKKNKKVAKKARDYDEPTSPPKMFRRTMQPRSLFDEDTSRFDEDTSRYNGVSNIARSLFDD